MIRRVNFYAGPGAGKSTLAARAFAELKIRGHDVEHIPEFVKTMAHEGRFPESYDQIHIFGEQIHREDIALRHVKAVEFDQHLLDFLAENMRGSLLHVQVENFDLMVEEIENQLKEE